MSDYSKRGDWARVEGSTSLGGSVRTPGDKSISHRALLVAALANGVSRLGGLNDGHDVACMKEAIGALGADVHEEGATTIVEGGVDRLGSPRAPIDCGNSGTAMRLLAGAIAALPIEATLVGDTSLSSRPMDRIAVPLRAMGASIEGIGERCNAPLVVRGGGLHGIEFDESLGSAQVKSAILFAALGARGETKVRESMATRAHSEELLAMSGASIAVREGSNGRAIVVKQSTLRPINLSIPGDPSQGAFFIVAGLLVPGSGVRVVDLYGGAQRVGFLQVLASMGASLEVVEGSSGLISVLAKRSALVATTVHPTQIPSLDEVPILAVAASAARGTTRFCDVGELRVKETDRLKGVADLVTCIGGEARIEGDDLIVTGRGRLRHARFDSQGDHRLAMAAAIAALAAGRGTSFVDGFSCVRTSYPGFVRDVVALGGGIRRPLIAIDGPAGSGKSTVAKVLTEQLGIERLDTGSMYRAVAWKALEQGCALGTRAQVAALARGLRIEPTDHSVVVDEVELSSELRSAAINEAVSVVASNPGVRAVLVDRQRAWARTRGGGVMEGRDIATVVLPHADVKVYLTATHAERARRRSEEGSAGIERRDRMDSVRVESPLRIARDAIQIDTTERSVNEVVEEICRCL